MRHGRGFILCALLVLLGSSIVAADGSGTLGRGLQQLVQLYESGDQRLDAALQLHITAPEGDPLVHVRLSDNVQADDAVARLAELGFRLQAISPLDATLLEGYLPLRTARAAAALQGVQRLLAVQRPFKFAGSVQSQAVAVEKADLVQARGVNGTGTRLGVLSDSFNSVKAHPNAADDVATGDLPPDVAVLQDLPAGQGTDEGRAMAQLVFDIAPGAKLGFATAFLGEVSFSNNILALRDTFQADVIVDDVIYLDEPMFSDGLLAKTVDTVVRKGAAYFSSAGNNGLEAYAARFDAVSEAEARKLVAAHKENLDLDALAAAGLMPESFHNFKNADGSPTITQKFTSFLAPGDTVDFQWDEPFNLGKVLTDYNIYVFDPAGHFINPSDPTATAFFTTDDNTKTDQALELLAVLPGNYQIVIGKMNDGPARNLKYVVVNGTGESARENAPSVWGHAAARRGQAVAAMFYGITKVPEGYSSPGPVTIYFDENGDRLDEPEIRRVPQITGIDGVDTTFFGSDTDASGHPNFFGTSAAAPDVAAVAALAIQAAGGPGQLRPSELYEELQDTATPVPLSENRTLARAAAGPVAATASGDFPRVTSYWKLAVDRWTTHTIQSVSIDLTAADMHWSNPASPTTGFHIGTIQGLAPGSVSVSRSLDLATLTLTFAAGAFGAGDVLTFANFAFPTLLPFQFPVDADLVRGGGVTVTLDDNSTATASFVTARMSRINPFTGAGLVNADAAARAISDHDHHDDHDEDADHEGDSEHHDRDRDRRTEAR
jgi:hypothetical protein